MARTPKKRGDRFVLYSRQWPDYSADKKTVPGDSVTPHLGHEYRLTSKFSEESMREQKDEPKSARETFGRRFKLTRAKHMPHPAPVKGGHYKSTPQMERPHYEELETPMSNKTFREALRDFEAIAEGRQPAEAPHMIVQLEKHVRNPEMNPLRFKNGQKAKIPEAMAHKAMKMHDSMNQSDKQAFVAHISKSIDHLKSGLKGEWKKDTKKSISLAGPKLRKEESDRPEQHTKTDVLVRKHTRLAADALGRAHHLGKDHKDYKKNMAEYERHRKIALGEESDHDDGWYTHKEMHGSKAISKEDWKKGVRPKKSVKTEEVELEESHRVGITYSDPNSSAVSQRSEKKFKNVRVKAESEEEAITKAKKHVKNQGYRVHNAEITTMKEEVEIIDETSQAKKDRYVERSASQASMANFTKRHATGKTKEDAENIERKRKAGLRMALKSKMDEEVEQIDEWGSAKIAKQIRGTRAKTSKMASIQTRSLKGKPTMPKVQKLTREELEIYESLSDEGKVLFEKMSSEQLAKMVAVFHARGGKIKRGKTPKRKESEKTWPASKMKGSKWAGTARKVTLKDQGYRG